jgi:hypothetical protein
MDTGERFCQAEFMFEPNDNYYSIEFSCQLLAGHEGEHVSRFASSELVGIPKAIVTISWTNGNVSCSDSKVVKSFPVGSWRSEDDQAG